MDNATLTAKEAAAIIGIDHTNLKKKALNGKIPYTRHGRAFVFKLEDIKTYKESYIPRAKSKAKVC